MALNHKWIVCVFCTAKYMHNEMLQRLNATAPKCYGAQMLRRPNVQRLNDSWRKFGEYYRFLSLILGKFECAVSDERYSYQYTKSL